MWKIKEWFLHYKEAIRISLLALFRWTLLAVCTGVLCGGIGTLFHLAVEWVTEQRAEQVWLLKMGNSGFMKAPRFIAFSF